MQFIPVVTRRLSPPKDDLLTTLDESLTHLEEGDVVIITSKVVSIHEGRCIAIGEVDKEKLVRNEAEYLCDVEGRNVPITIIHNALISSSGIDESNGNGYYTLLPKDPFASAQMIHAYLQDRFGCKNIGVVITDSHSAPLRYGAMSIAIGCWGFEPVISHVGKSDLFGRATQYAHTNIADALSAGATLVSGECAESSPVVIARDVPNLIFSTDHPKDALFVPKEQDFFRSLLGGFIKGGKQS